MIYSPPTGFNIMFHLVSTIVVIGFILVFGLIIVQSIKGVQQWNRNNASPVLTVDATVITKRSDVHHSSSYSDSDHMSSSSSSTNYFVTFEVASGDRMEFQIRDTEFGLLAEHDTGKLTFQGTRYLGFERNKGGVSNDFII